LEDFVETVMLVCAVTVSLALGVLVSYALCQGMFRVFRVHSQVAARNRQVDVAGVPVALEA
jgi:hypothetical protein